MYEGSDGVLELVDGVTRADTVAKLLPGTTVRVEVLGKLRRPKAQNRRIETRSDDNCISGGILGLALPRSVGCARRCVSGSSWRPSGCSPKTRRVEPMDIEDEELAAAVEQFATDMARFGSECRPNQTRQETGHATDGFRASTFLLARDSSRVPRGRS